MKKVDVNNKLQKLIGKYEETRDAGILVDTITDIIDILQSLDYGDNSKIAKSLIYQLKNDLKGGALLKLSSKYIGIRKMNIEFALSHLPYEILEMAIF